MTIDAGKPIEDVNDCERSTRTTMACVSAGAKGAWHPQNIKTSRLAPSDFEILSTNGTPRASFYRTDGTRSFKFLTQALTAQTFKRYLRHGPSNLKVTGFSV